MNDKTLQELVLQTMKSNSEKLDVVSKDVVEVCTITKGMTEQLGKLEKKSHSAPCADVQTLRERICTSARNIKWFVGLIVVAAIGLLGYWSSRS